LYRMWKCFAKEGTEYPGDHNLYKLLKSVQYKYIRSVYSVIVLDYEMIHFTTL